MSQATSPTTKRVYGLKRVCEHWGVPRSRIYQRRSTEPKKRGPVSSWSDADVLNQIKEDLKASPFKGEGHRKSHARIKKQGTRVGRNRVLRLMRENDLLSPNRSVYRPKNPHKGRITTDAPNVMWSSDGTKIWTVEDGWVWVFSVADHWNTECLGYHVVKKGDRFAAYEPISQAVKNAYGAVGKNVANGLKLRIDNGCQYTSEYFLQQANYLGIEISFGLVRQPETNGVSERFHRTLKEQICEGRAFKNVDEVREAVGGFVEVYNEQWLVAKRGYQSPKEARRRHNSSMEAA